MKQIRQLGAAALLVLMTSGTVMGGQTGSREEIDSPKEKQQVLEQAGGKGVEKRWYETIALSLGATGVVQGTAGVREELRSGGDLTAGSLNADLSAAAPLVSNGSLFVHFKGLVGKGVDGDIPSLTGVNSLATARDDVQLWELWYEHKWFDEKLRFRAGKIDLTSDFDTNRAANDERTQFFSNGFVNNPAAEFPEKNGLGAQLWVAPHPLIDVGVGMADATGSWREVTRAPFVIAEIDVKPRFGARQGNYRFYGWYNGKDHTDQKDPLKTEEPNSGFGLSFDQELSETVTAFVRYGRQKDGVATVGEAWSAGLELSGRLYGREADALGAAYGRALLGKDADDVAQAGGIRTGHEHHAEAYYRFRVHEHFDLSPHVQWLKNINGGSDRADVWVFGLRARLAF